MWREWWKISNWQQANVKGDRTKAGPLTCGIERLFMTSSGLLIHTFHQLLSMALLNNLAIHVTITRVSQNMSQDAVRHSFRDDNVPWPRTGHWCPWWWMMAGLVTTRDSAPSDDGASQSSVLAVGLSRPQPPTINPVPGRRMRCPHFPHCSVPSTGVVTYNDGTGPGLGLVTARQTPEYWSWGGRGAHTRRTRRCYFILYFRLEPANAFSSPLNIYIQQ